MTDNVKKALEYHSFLKEIISDKEVADCFHGANFGSSEPREVIADTLLKLHCDYSTGSTAMKICHELGLIGKTRKLTKKGRYYLFWAYADHHPSTAHHITQTAGRE